MLIDMTDPRFCTEYFNWAHGLDLGRHLIIPTIRPVLLDLYIKKGLISGIEDLLVECRPWRDKICL